MSNIKVKVYQTVLKELTEKYNGADDFINNVIDEIYSQGKLSAEEIIYCFVGFLQFMFPC